MKEYEYRCPICNSLCTTGEALREDMIPFCFGRDIEHEAIKYKRVYSFSGTILKGTGWAKKDKYTERLRDKYQK